MLFSKSNLSGARVSASTEPRRRPQMSDSVDGVGFYATVSPRFFVKCLRGIRRECAPLAFPWVLSRLFFLPYLSFSGSWGAFLKKQPERGRGQSPGGAPHMTNGELGSAPYILGAYVAEPRIVRRGWGGDYGCEQRRNHEKIKPAGLLRNPAGLIFKCVCLRFHFLRRRLRSHFSYQ